MKEKVFLSIFTPTYNRAYILDRLFKSLLKQEYKNFEWIIVDDGSTDDTEELVSKFEAEADFPVRYHKKENEGKHLAINKGVKLAKGELFFIVDSDDYLTPDATKKIEAYFPKIASPGLAGVSFRRGYSATAFIGSTYFEEIETDVAEFRYKRKIEGDMAEVYKTSVIRQFPFPKIEGEKFCPESLVWNRIGSQYQMLWTSHIIYICEYLEDGLTSKIVRLRQKSPGYATLYYAEFVKLNIPLSQRIKGAVNFWRFGRFNQVSFKKKWAMLPLGLNLVGFPLGTFFSLVKDRR